jgi:hypothetical protein
MGGTVSLQMVRDWVAERIWECFTAIQLLAMGRGSSTGEILYLYNNPSRLADHKGPLNNLIVSRNKLFVEVEIV